MSALVSIVVPSYNQGRYIRETLESCLAQDYRPIEVLVMDGASSDETLDVLRSFDCAEVTWKSERDGGVVDAVNKGLGLARGDIVTIQSSDDLFLPGAVSAAVEALQRNPGLGLVYGDVELVDEASQVRGADVQGPFDMAEYLGRFQYIPQPGTFFTRKAMQSVGGWREPYSYAADADFWMRIALKWPVRKLDRKMARYRYHPQQRDRQARSIAESWEGAVRDLLGGAITDARCRRYARMGIELAWYRYTPVSHWLRRTYHLYRAMIANPEGVTHARFPRGDLIPGRQPIRSLLSRAKRRLAGRTPGAVLS